MSDTDRDNVTKFSWIAVYKDGSILYAVVPFDTAALALSDCRETLNSLASIRPANFPGPKCFIVTTNASGELLQ